MLSIFGIIDFRSHTFSYLHLIVLEMKRIKPTLALAIECRVWKLIQNSSHGVTEALNIFADLLMLRLVSCERVGQAVLICTFITNVEELFFISFRKKVNHSGKVGCIFRPVGLTFFSQCLSLFLRIFFNPMGVRCWLDWQHTWNHKQTGEELKKKSIATGSILVPSSSQLPDRTFHNFGASKSIDVSVLRICQATDFEALKLWKSPSGIELCTVVTTYWQQQKQDQRLDGKRLRWMYWA